MLPLGQMKRLVPLLAAEEGEVQVRLRFGIDEMGVHYLTGSIDTALQLVCQRCLGELDLPVNTELSLGFVASAAEAERLPGGYEPYIVESVPVALIDMIEDELILALPQIPMHEPQDCPAQQYMTQAASHEQDQAGAENPFQILANLKKPDKG